MVILFDSCAVVKSRTSFGVGLAVKVTVLKPVGRWASPREAREHFLASTLSTAEWNARLERRAVEAAQMDLLARGIVLA